MIERSLRCFTLGLFGLIPIIGVPMAVRSLMEYHRVTRSQGPMWNPARRYLVCGCVFAELSLVFFLIVPLVIVFFAAFVF